MKAQQSMSFISLCRSQHPPCSKRDGLQNIKLKIGCCQVENPPRWRRAHKLSAFPKYITIGNTGDTEHEITLFTQQPNKILFQHAEKLVAEALRFEDVYENYDLNQIFIEGLGESRKQSTRGYCAYRKFAGLLDLTFYVRLLLKLHVDQQELSDVQVCENVQNRRTIRISHCQPLNVINS